MKINILSLLITAFASVNANKTFEYYKEQGYNIMEHAFGQFQVRLSDSETHVFNVEQNITTHPELLESLQSQMAEITIEEVNEAFLYCHKADEANVFQFGAWNTGVIGNEGLDSQTINLLTNKDTCFANIEVTYTKTSSNSFTLEFVGSQAQGGLNCINSFQYATAETFYLPIYITRANPKHTITIENQTEAQMEQIPSFGIHIFQTCDKLTNIIGDIVMTFKLLYGGWGLDPDTESLWSSKPFPEQILANINFIKDGTGFQWEKRNNVLVDLSDDEVHPGDFLIITRFDGIDNLISWGTGGQVGHTCIIVEIDGVKYVVESQDGWYWPRSGIQKNTWTQWKEWAQNADFNVAILPLKPELRQKFIQNQDKALDFFYSVEGVPYGYHNMLFGWLDDMPNNFPPLATFDYLYVVFSQIEKIVPGPIVSAFGEALNFRLGTKDLTLAQIAVQTYNRGMDLNDLLNIPEKDEWVYSDGPSMNCCSLVTAMLKHGGLFDDLDITYTEFTPRDVYQLAFWDTAYERPTKCIAADPDLPYCQVMGEYQMNVYYDKWSTIEPYDKMFQRCPSMTPLYERVTSGPDRC